MSREVYRRPVKNTYRRASVDGFLPSARTPRRAHALVQPQHTHMQIQTAPQQHTSTTTPPVAPPDQPPAAQNFSAQMQPKKQHRFALLQDIGIAIAACVLGFLIQSPVVGQVAIAAYAICVFVFRMDSRPTFVLALLALAMVLFSNVRANGTAAGTYAVYAFLLLVVGTISLGREARNEL